MITMSFSIEGVTPAAPGGTALTPFEVAGTESISTPYRFEVSCEIAMSALPGREILGCRAELGIDFGDGVPGRRVYGVIEAFELDTPATADALPTGRFRLVPSLALLALSRQTQLFATATNMSVVDIMKAEMGGTLREGSETQPKAIPATPYDSRLKESYLPLDQIAHYEETNLSFLSRLLERYGIFYFFDAVDGRERVVFADDNVFAPKVAGGSLDWHGWSSGSSDTHPNTVQQLRAQHAQVPGSLHVHDYNYLVPSVNLLSKADVDLSGTGIWVETEEDYLNRSSGAFLARIRAQELACRKTRLTGRSFAAQLAAGHAFTLARHPTTEWNKDYLVVAVHHTARVPKLGSGPEPGMGYANTFTAIPLDIPFRPERVTPLPRLSGLVNGQIEGAPDSIAPLMDDQGRYKVRLPFDLSNSDKGKGSQWVRLATPFTGDGEGMHFPLRPGTEVMVGHVNGDPDRPVIMGALSNPATASMVTRDDAQHNRINFRTGIGLDAIAKTSATENALRLWVDKAAAGGDASLPYQWLRLGAAADWVTKAGGTTVREGSNAEDGFDLATGGTGRLFAKNDLYLIRRGHNRDASVRPAAAGTVDYSSASSDPNQLMSITGSELLLAHDGKITIGEAEGGKGTPSSVTLNSSGPVKLKAGGDYSFLTVGNKYSVMLGSSESVTAGAAIAAIGGNDTKVVVGVQLGVALVSKIDIVAGIKIALTTGMTVDATPTTKFSSSGFAMVKATPASVKLANIDSAIATAKNEIAATYATINNVSTALTTAHTDIAANRAAIVNTNTRITTLETDINSSIQTNLKAIATELGQIQNQIYDLDVEVCDLVMKL